MIIILNMIMIIITSTLCSRVLFKLGNNLFHFRFVQLLTSNGNVLSYCLYQTIYEEKRFTHREYATTHSTSSLVVTMSIPYSGKFSRSKTFAVFADH